VNGVHVIGSIDRAGILALALPILLDFAIAIIDLHARAKELTTATILAQEKLIETELGTLLLSVRTGGISSNSPGSQATAEITNRPFELPVEADCVGPPLPIVNEVKIQIYGHEGQRKKCRGQYLCLFDKYNSVLRAALPWSRSCWRVFGRHDGHPWSSVPLCHDECD